MRALCDVVRVGKMLDVGSGVEVGVYGGEASRVLVGCPGSNGPGSGVGAVACAVRCGAQ